ncbi:hypothetical protein QVD17_20360 [Tagetes erecta]|uniref:Uncharacterized protein n=1 Tax=Tagetes erecta TaxID=13708 RepID=A0AAD8KP04_TARER|nr:hypothetical protein QVD17_20360 [Tagetes erecta]
MYIAAARDKVIVQLEKDNKTFAKDLQEEKARVLKEVQAAVDEAKEWDVKLVIQARIKMAKQVATADLDMPEWNLAKWEQTLTNLDVLEVLVDFGVVLDLLLSPVCSFWNLYLGWHFNSPRLCWCSCRVASFQANHLKMSIQHVSNIKLEMSLKPIEIEAIKKWGPYASDKKKKPYLWFLFIDVHLCNRNNVSSARGKPLQPANSCVEMLQDQQQYVDATYNTTSHHAS